MGACFGEDEHDRRHGEHQGLCLYDSPGRTGDKEKDKCGALFSGRTENML